MKKNQIREDQCCCKAHTSVSWSACQPSAHEVAGLIRLMHLLIGLTGLFNKIVIFSKRSFFNILRQGTLHKLRVATSTFLSPPLEPEQRRPEHWREGFRKIAFPGYGNSSPTTNHSLVVEMLKKITLGRTVLCPRRQICAYSSLL